MREFEDELRQALCRREPPEGFAERVLARVERKRARRPVWLAMAASVLVAVAGAGLWQANRKAAAEAELKQALTITAQSLETTQALLARHLGGRKL